jgi:hypothetical protein
MSKKAELLKAAMIKKAMERAAPEEEITDAEFEDIPEDPEYLDEEEPEYVPVVDEHYDGALDEEEVDFIYEAQAQVAQEAGFEAFLTGVDFEDNPFLKDETILEGLDEAESTVLIEGWNVGWQEGCKEAWTAEVILGAKSLIETDSPDDAEALLEHLTAAVGVLGDFIDFEAYEAFWRGEEE